MPRFSVQIRRVRHEFCIVDVEADDAGAARTIALGVAKTAEFSKGYDDDLRVSSTTRLKDPA